MAFTPDGKYLWVTNETDGTITIVDVAKNQAVETFKCPGIIKRIRFTDDGKLALITSWTEEGELIVLDVDGRKEVKRIIVGDRAIGVEISPDGKYAFVGCEDAIEAVVAACRHADVVVVATVNAATDPSQRRLVARLSAMERTPHVLALRSPVDAAHLTAARSVICSYGRRAVQTDAALAVLFGEAEAPGRLPLRLTQRAATAAAS